MSRKGCAVKVTRTRIGVLVASCGLLASVLGLTGIAVSSAAAGIVGVASVANVLSSTPCSNATVIEAGRCVAA